ncbi:hypothetical protein QEN19_002920 [Hanseniaspora menglaensis]
MSQQSQQILLPLNHPQFAAKLKIIIKMLLKRISLKLKEEEHQAKVYQREVAKLLSEKNKEQKAYYKAEAMIMEDSTVQMLEILENYCEMLLVRIPILNNTISNEKELEKSESLEKGIKTLLYASIYFPEFKELSQFKELMMLKFGKGFIDASIYIAKGNNRKEKEIKEEEQEEVESQLVVEKINKTKEEVIEESNNSPGFDDVFLKLSQRNIVDCTIVETYLKEIAMAYKVFYSKLSQQQINENLGELNIDRSKEKSEETQSTAKSSDNEKMSDLEKRFALLKQKK